MTSIQQQLQQNIDNSQERVKQIIGPFKFVRFELLTAVAVKAVLGRDNV